MNVTFLPDESSQTVRAVRHREFYGRVRFVRRSGGNGSAPPALSRNASNVRYII